MRVELDKEKKRLIRYFDNPTDLMDRALSPLPSWVRSPSSTSTDEISWAGGTWEEALVLAEQGWPEGADRLEKAVQGNLETINLSKIPKPHDAYDVTGHTVDIDRFLEGVPENMISEACSPIKARTVELLVCRGINSGSDSEDIMERGIIIASYADYLERSGISVGITIFFHVRTREDYHITYYMRCKEPSEPMPGDRLAYYLGHTTLLRRIKFACMEREEEWLWEQYGSGYGRSVELTKRDAPKGYDVIVQTEDLMDMDIDEGIEWLSRLTRDKLMTG